MIRAMWLKKGGYKRHFLLLAFLLWSYFVISFVLESRKNEDYRKREKEEASNVKGEEPKVKEEEPKVKQEELKVKEEEPKVKEEAPKVKEEEPKVKEEDPKVKEEEPKLKELEPNVKEEEPKVKEEEPKVKEEAPKVKEEEPKVDEEDPKVKISMIEKSIKSLENQGGCTIPILPHDAPEMMKFIKTEPPIDCGQDEDWVACSMSACVIKQHIIAQKGGNVLCDFTDLLRKNDYATEDGLPTPSTDRYLLQKSDFVRVKCEAADNSTWSGTLLGIREDAEILKRNQTVAKGVNVLMMGFDSLSRNAVMRSLPKAYEYLTKELRADVLKGYNIVGDGTPQALTPILTGFTELELPEVRKRIAQSTYVNVYPWIWNDYEKAGYATAFNEDQPSIGTYTYRLNGFDQQPTDHYMRTFYLAAEGDFGKYKRLCLGSRPRHQVMLDYTKDFIDKYNNVKPSFVFSFHAELSHDSINLVSVADDDITNWLKSLKESGTLNNTILIMMADHGNRFADIRNTLQGKVEERLPFFSFVFPEWFKLKYPAQYKNFQNNVDRLTTPFDVHETLRDIIDMPPEIVRKPNHVRATSLFNEISEHRTCGDAFIEPHWCSCLSWEVLNDKTSEEVVRASKAVADTINNSTMASRDLCEMLHIKEIVWSAKLVPQKSLLHFKSNKDHDGFLGNFEANTTVTNDMFQVKIITIPGDAIYEATCLHDSEANEFRVALKDISRVNQYGDQARCIYEKNPELRKFCYCK